MKSLLAGFALLLAAPGIAHAQYAPPGYRCDARFGTPYGPRGLVCPLVRVRPLGAPCHCRPQGPPGYGYEPPIRGRVIP